MKQIISALFLCMLLSAVPGLQAQNIQLHYDFGRSLYDKDLQGRPLLTSTVEKFHPDTWGSTYFFVDMDYTSEGVAAAYWEIAREVKFWKGPFSAHLEYNGGLSKGMSYKNAYLAGATYTFNNASFSKGFTLTAMYKYIQKHSSPNNFQLTGTWYVHFVKNGLCTFSGFADWWRERTDYADGRHRNFIFLADWWLEETNYGKTIFLSEPQFWVNLNQIKGVNKNFNLSVGSEVELSNNFGGRDGFYVIPTLALKWTLN